MLIACLTSIPPRFENLRETIEDLHRQSRPPDRIEVNLPSNWLRFAKADMPVLPDGVDLYQGGPDLGPIMKLVPSLRRWSDREVTLLICDDDCRYGPGWVDTLLEAARRHPGNAITGAGFSANRLGRTGERHERADAGRADIAQGYAGVLFEPGMIHRDVLCPPACAWSVDDIWISAMLALAGTAIAEAPAARAQVTALDRPGALQSATVGGLDRAAANAATLAWVQARYGIWRT